MIKPINLEQAIYSQNANFESINNINNAKESTNQEKLKKQAQEFEAVFIAKLLNTMDSTVEKSGFLSGGKNEKMFKSMMYQEVARDISSDINNSFGLAKQMYEQMKDLV